MSKNRQMKLNEMEGRKEEWKDRGEKGRKRDDIGPKKAAFRIKTERTNDSLALVSA